MTPLGRLLLNRIAADGPMPLSDYMAECLLHPHHGYYTGRDPLGRDGDFTTAPEISQMFGEIIGLWLAQIWLDQGSPVPFALAELGPGRGTLMADILRAIRVVPGMADAARLHLVEASPVLRARQAATLAGHKVDWHPGPGGLPDLPLLLVANEFFDAMPIRQFVRSGGGWAERVVTSADGRLALALAPPAPLAALDGRLADTREGDVVEICPALPAIAAEVAGRIARRGGAALVIDYGGWRSLGDTFQAVRGHASADPLSEPGLADLTAHVDFEALSGAFAAAGTVPSPMVNQGEFLARLGIAVRAEKLAARLTGQARDAHIAALHRLTAPREMGEVFKVVAAAPPAAAPLPGLDHP